MPKITTQQDYNGVAALIERLGLRPLIDEIEQILTGFALRVKEQRTRMGAPLF